jgi:hypothetical protein
VPPGSSHSEMQIRGFADARPSYPARGRTQAYQARADRKRSKSIPPPAPPVVADLEKVFNKLVSALIDDRARRPAPRLIMYSLEELQASSIEQLEIDEWKRAPVDRALKNALRAIAVLIAPLQTHSQVGAMIERIAIADQSNYGLRTRLLEKAFDELICMDGIWLC